MCWWLTRARKKMWWWIASFGYSYHDNVLQYCLAAAILAAAAKPISWQGSQAAHGVAMVQSSATKINNSAIYLYCPASLYYALLFVRESWLWHVLLPWLDSYSYFRDTLQNAKQLFLVGSRSWPNTLSWGSVRISSQEAKLELIWKKIATVLLICY